MTTPSERTRGNSTAQPRTHTLAWAWATLLATTLPALWLIWHEETAPDGEYPMVERPTFSPYPPIAYRWAEPGDTLDKIALYLSAAGLVLAFGQIVRRVSSGASIRLWPLAAACFVAVGWNAVTPWPTPDGWHGFNYRALSHPDSPVWLKMALGWGVGLITVVGLWNLHRERAGLASYIATARNAGVIPFFLIAAALVACRFTQLPAVGPAGFWTRWAAVWGLTAVLIALVRLGGFPFPTGRRLAWATVSLLSVGALISGGRWLIWYQRPIERLRTVVPGRIFLSAMPSYRGLEIAQRRHKFKTIINVFDESTHQRSPKLNQELRFVRDHGLSYVGNPGDEASDAFLDTTLALAQDPEAWPILVHCHGCMDRSPAWMGMYRFLVEKKPLLPIMQEIEAHRGIRPKASVTLLYNHVLRPRDPERYAADPTARRLLEAAADAPDPYHRRVGKLARSANAAGVDRVDLDASLPR